MIEIERAVLEVMPEILSISSSELLKRVVSKTDAKENTIKSTIQRLIDNGKLIRLNGGAESRYALGNLGLKFGQSRKMMVFNRAISEARRA
ncbi:hypothetical protein [Pantoea sp. 1.19]|uniref:hypothetical protein n=1 Tax=Pantoea sp. 1.19 TaxID=1925589 RepID=UPI0011150947|nr:hypothetical protein [Pantoea sp. 1.19]